MNLFLHYYPGSKQGKRLDAHYNCSVNTQYYKQNAAAISSMMVKTIEEEEAEKALKKTNKGKTATTWSTNVQSIMDTQKEEAKKTSQKQKKSDASSSKTRNLQSSTRTAEEEKL